MEEPSFQKGFLHYMSLKGSFQEKKKQEAHPCFLFRLSKKASQSFPRKRKIK